MSQTNVRWGCVACALSFSAAVVAGGNTPITDGRTALRSVLTGVFVANEATSQINSLTLNAQSVIDQGLKALAARTTAAALMSAGGIEIPCEISGTLRARMATSWPRVVKFDWNSCASDFFGAVQTLNGPGEVTLIGDTFAPTVIAGLRLGDGTHDLTLDAPIVGNPNNGGSSVHMNVRFVGVLPLTRAYDFGPFVGRYAFEVDGFRAGTSFLPLYPDPGPPFYAQTLTYTADHVAVSGQWTIDPVTQSDFRENRLLRGTLSTRIDSPATPTRAARTTTESETFQDLNVIWRVDYPPQGVGRFSLSIDGKAQPSLGKFWGFKGCTAAETWSWQTKVPISYDFNNLLYSPDRGELVVNDRATADFRITGNEYGVDQRGNVDIAVRGLGTFNFTALYDLSELVSAAGCTP